MSAVNALTSLKENSSDGDLDDGFTHEGTEESGVEGVSDPAVLAVGPVRKPLTYTREELMRLRNSPLVRRNLENAFAGCEALALVLKKRSDSPNDEDRGARGDAPNENHKGVYGRERERRAADPRERVRKESEPATAPGGIVLSPQRRSFTSGCGAPPPAPDPPAHPPPKAEQGRRIGSGRIMVRDGQPAWEEPEYRAEPYRPPAPRERQPAERYDRRSFSRDSYSSDMKRERDDRFNNEKNRDREDNRRSGGRYSRRYDKEDEPEWFSSGPTSQLETIELRGFDEPVKKTINNKDTEKWNNSNSNSNSNSAGEKSPPAERWREQADDSNSTVQDKDSGVDIKCEELPSNEPDFNLDDFLKLDSIPDVLTNGSGEAEGSRFSRWFHRESPNSDARHNDWLMHNIVDNLDKNPQPSGAEGGHVFAPIAPAPAPPPAAPPSLLDLLRRANANADCRPEMSSMGGKMQSLEELEARLRPQLPAPPTHIAHPSHPVPPAHHEHQDHDLTAFKRLLAQVSGGHAVPAASDPPRHHQTQNMSLLQMLNKSMEQQKPPPPQPQPPQQPHIPQELLYKLLQVQQRQQQATEMSTMQAGPSPADRELLQRPEAQAIIHGLKAGEITVQHLMQQLNNPGMQSRHREVLHTILRLHHQRQNMGGSPLGAGAGAALLAVPPHHQPLRLSPLPHSTFCASPIMATSPNTLAVHHPGMPARIPSPRELAAHTQSIMQGALIKKKLEEQRENYRRRHEIQPKQPTPISFTPTSVLRKMTADKEPEATSPKQHMWTQSGKLPQGRPIVKGNQSGGVPPQGMGYTPTPAEYQQHYLNQQMSGGRPFLHAPQRQQLPNSMSNMNHVSRGITGGTTLHQLLVQSQQRSINEMGGVGAGTGGGDNQLARWFSPELLARASAGKLPSVHVPNALSLEDLERHHHSPAPPVRN